ncbi:MAG: LysM peptidoglycan-binding domain-containing protein [Anaerolineae bacterium]|nr:LysM peptidoglycan-binding domain-containing protein [Anaerolineae bacterium]
MRALAQAVHVDAPSGAVQRRVWQRASAAALSPDGKASEPAYTEIVPYQNESLQERVNVNSSIGAIHPGRFRPFRRFGAQWLTLAAALAAVVLFGALLAYINGQPAPEQPGVGGSGAQDATVTPPPTATITATPIMFACMPYPGWTHYIVQPGDTLAALSARFGVSQQEMQIANCLPDGGGTLTVGQRIWAPPFALDTPQIAVGDRVSGALDADQTVFAYRIAAARDIVLFLRLTTEGFEPFLGYAHRHVDADGAIQNRASGSVSGTGIVIFDLEAGDEVSVTVSSLQPGAAGAFTLTLEEAPPHTELSYGDTVESAIADDADNRLFFFKGAVGDVVSLRVDSDDVDTRLSLLDSKGATYITDDDGGRGFNPEIMDFMLPAELDYYVLVEPVSQGAQGRFSLALELVDQQPVPAPAEMPAMLTEATPIEIGDTITGALDADAAEALYAFNTESEGVVAVYLASADFVPVLSHAMIHEGGGGRRRWWGRRVEAAP